MKMFLDSLWRAVAYCLHPRAMLLSMLPLLIMVSLAWAASYWLWDLAVDSVRGLLETSSVFAMVWQWFVVFGVRDLKSVVAPLVVIFSVTPIVVVLSLLVVSFMMTPALLSWVASRRFPDLARKNGGNFLASLGWSLLSVLIALFALLLTLPLWLMPPLAMLIPPVIWGWLTYRVLTYDVLAVHASRDERLVITREHRLTLMSMGVVTGLMGAAPSLVWASGALFAAAFVVLVPLAVWLYTLVFAFSSLWFSHFALAALAELRRREVVSADLNQASLATLETTPRALPAVASAHPPDSLL
jgi:hypothetical protein